MHRNLHHDRYGPFIIMSKPWTTRAVVVLRDPETGRTIATSSTDRINQAWAEQLAAYRAADPARTAIRRVYVGPVLAAGPNAF